MFFLNTKSLLLLDLDLKRISSTKDCRFRLQFSGCYLYVIFCSDHFVLSSLQISAGLMYADQGPHVQLTAEHVALDPAGMTSLG